MLLENHRSFITKSLSFIFVRAMNYQKMIFRNNSVTHFLSIISIRNRIKYKKTSINSYITHSLVLIAFRNTYRYRWMTQRFFESYSSQRQILMHEGDYQHLHQVFVNFQNFQPFSKIALSHIC